MEFEDEAEKPRRPPPEDSIAHRCRIAREHGKLTRWIVNGAAGLSRGHYGRIEDHFIKRPAAHVCRQLVLGFARLGIKVSLDWLMAGEGKAPSRLRKPLAWNRKAFMTQQARQSEHYRKLREQRYKRARRKTNAG